MIDFISSAAFGNQPGDGPFRYGGVSLPSTTVVSSDADLPSTPNAAAKRQGPDLAIVRDLSGGNRRVKAGKQLYLPQADGETHQNYQARLQRSVFFAVFAETVRGLTGLVFTKDPVLGDDVPANMLPHLENIDNAGTHLDVFAADVFADALTAGHNGILVEYPKTDGKQTAADEKGAIRPYWVPILKDNIVSWRVSNVGGRTLLSQLVLRECTTVPDGAYGEKEQTRYRVFARDENGTVGYRLLEIAKDNRTVTEIESGLYPTQDEIPFAEIMTSGKRAMLDSDPPLVDLGHLNIAHYQMWSDRATSINRTCVPIWVETGVDATAEGQQQQIVLGPNNARTFTNPAATAGYQSHDGAALAQVTAVLEELKADMAVLGIEMLAPAARHAETAAAKLVDKAASDSKLGRAARGLQDGLERALYFHARYMKLPSGGSITVNRDFENLTMLPEMLTAYVGAVANAGIPVRVLLEAMQKGGLLADSANLDEIEAKIAVSGATQPTPAQAAA